MHPTPLLEEEWDIRLKALVADVYRPGLRHRSRARTRLATYDDPVNVFKVESPKRPKKRLKREEPDRCIALPEQLNPMGIACCLDTGAHPDVGPPVELGV